VPGEWGSWTLPWKGGEFEPDLSPVLVLNTREFFRFLQGLTDLGTTTTFNLKCMSFLFRMLSKQFCKVELEAKFQAKFFSHLAILQPVKLAFDCH